MMLFYLQVLEPGTYELILKRKYSTYFSVTANTDQDQDPRGSALTVIGSLNPDPHMHVDKLLDLDMS